MRNFIEGYDELEKKLGYEPNFHDDKIENITITKDNIVFVLRTVDDVLYNLIFEDVEDIDLKGKMRGIIGIIFEIEVKQNAGKLNSIIGPSLGIYAEIISKKIIVK